MLKLSLSQKEIAYYTKEWKTVVDLLKQSGADLKRIKIVSRGVKE